MSNDVFDQLSTALANRYTIERELGRGGMAIVYLAQDLKLERPVAIKVLRPELAATLGPDRFLREVKIAAQLNHPHILMVIDSGEVSGSLYYVMPYVKGESLREKLARERELPISDTVRILRDVVDALALAHNHGVIHRDIKPDNVMISGRHALVADFGVAKAVSRATVATDLTTAGVALGTPTYMSPEQAAADEQVDHRSDIYAVGVLAYELLTGRPPFLGTTPQMVLSAHLSDTPDPLTKYRKSVPPQLEQLVLRCLEKEPADRWQSAEDLLPLLEAMATPSGGVTPVTAAPVSRGRVRKNKAVLGSIVVFGLLVPVAFVWWLLNGPNGIGTAEPVPIAVLPFEMVIGSDEDESFVQGVREEISTLLSGIAGLSVRGHTSVVRLTQGGTDPRDIASQVGVEYFVVGSVSRLPDSIHVNARLVSVETEELAWADSYSRLLTASNYHAVASGIAQQIAEALHVTLSTAEQEDIATPATESIEALNAYRLGRFHWTKRTFADVTRAIEYFNEAIAADSGYAPAYVGLADCFMAMGTQAWLPPSEAWPRMEDAVIKALELDSLLAEGWASMGYVHLINRRWSQSLLSAQQGITLQPDYASGRQFYAEILGILGELELSKQELEHVLRLDPFSPMFGTDYGEKFFWSRDYKKAIETYEGVIDMHPTYPLARLRLAHAQEQLGMWQAALANYEGAAELANGSPAYLAELARFQAIEGQRAEAMVLLDSLERLSTHEYVSGYHLALVHMGLGDTDGAIESLTEAANEGFYRTLEIRLNPQLDPLRSDPRFQELVESVGFPN